MKLIYANLNKQNQVYGISLIKYTPTQHLLLNHPHFKPSHPYYNTHTHRNTLTHAHTDDYTYLSHTYIQAHNNDVQ